MKKLLFIFLIFNSLLPINAQVEFYSDCSGTFHDGSDEYSYSANGYNMYYIEGYNVSLSFTSFILGSANDFVYVIEVNDFGENIIGKYSKNNLPPRTITSCASYMYIIFATDDVWDEGPEDGWTVEYTSDCAYTNLKNNILGYYSFNYNASDVSGKGKNAIISNASHINDRFGNAYNFNGSNSFMYLPNNLMTDANAFAISCWVKVNGNNAVPSDYGQTIIDLRGQYQIALSYYEAEHPTYKNSFMFYTWSSPNSKMIFTPNNFVQFGTWYHLLANYSNNLMEFYVNGVLIGSCAQTPPGTVSGYNNTLGKDYNLYLNRSWFFGSIDDVSFFKTGLQATEIQLLYRRGLIEKEMPQLYGPIVFSYDANGNRTGKNTIMLKSGSFTAAVRDSASTAETMNGKITPPEIYQEPAGESLVKIYPNPTRGELKVEIIDFDFAQKSAIFVYNTAGKLIIKKNPATGSNILNLINEANGMYIMKIILGDKTSDWKIIKE